MGRDKRDASNLAEVSRHLGAGLTWVLSTLLFLWLGTLADGWLGTEPWLALVGAFVGAAAGFISMIRQVTGNPKTKAGPDGDERGDRREDGGSDQGSA